MQIKSLVRPLPDRWRWWKISKNWKTLQFLTICTNYPSNLNNQPTSEPIRYTKQFVSTSADRWRWFKKFQKNSEKKTKKKTPANTTTNMQIKWTFWHKKNCRRRPNVRGPNRGRCSAAEWAPLVVDRWRKHETPVEKKGEQDCPILSFLIHLLFQNKNSICKLAWYANEGRGYETEIMTKNKIKIK